MYTLGEGGGKLNICGLDRTTGSETFNCSVVSAECSRSFNTYSMHPEFESYKEDSMSNM